MSGDRDDRDEPDEGEPVPDSDPRHLDPAGDLADAVESGEFNIELDDDQGEAELREFVERAEAGEFDADPALEATARIARALLEGDHAGDDVQGDEQ